MITIVKKMHFLKYFAVKFDIMSSISSSLTWFAQLKNTVILTTLTKAIEYHVKPVVNLAKAA